MSVIILNVGIGNLKSIEAWMRRLLIEYSIVNCGQSFQTDLQTRLILPGVGDSVDYVNRLSSWSDALETLQRREFHSVVGICAGFQALCTTVSEQGREGVGVGLIPAVSRDGFLSRPHNGWSDIDLQILGERRDQTFGRPQVYFNHSCCVLPDGNLSGFQMDRRGFAIEYTSDGIFGLQYHPEKSGLVGEAIGEVLFNV